MATRRRWLQFSLRTAFVGLTVGCIWMGWKVDRARKQADAVEEIEALEAKVYYECQLDYMPYAPYSRPWLEKHPPELPEPRWLRRTVGDDFFHDAQAVIFRNPLPPVLDSEVQKSIPYLKQLRRLRIVRIPDAVGTVSSSTLAELEAALPNCKIEFYY